MDPPLWIVSLPWWSLPLRDRFWCTFLWEKLDTLTFEGGRAIYVPMKVRIKRFYAPDPRRLSFCYNPIGQHKTQTNPSQSMTVDMHIRAYDFDSQWWLNALESQPINHQWPCFHVEGIWYRVWNSPSLWIPSRLYIRSPYALVIETNLAQWFPMQSTLGCLALEERSVSDTDWWPLPSSKRDFYYFCRKGWESDWRGKG